MNNITDERSEFFINDGKYINFKQYNKEERHGISLTLAFKKNCVDYYFIDIYNHNVLTFQLQGENEDFTNLYYKSHFTETHSLLHIIFDYNSFFLETPSFEEIFILIYNNQVYVLHRIISNVCIQSLSKNFKEDYEQLHISDQLIDIEPFFYTDSNWIDDLIKINWSSFHLVGDFLDYLKSITSEMKRFCKNERYQ